MKNLNDIRKLSFKNYYQYFLNKVDGKIHNAKFIEKQGGEKPTDKIEPKKLDADKVIEWMCNNTEYFWNSPYTPNGFINQFKKDFGL